MIGRHLRASLAPVVVVAAEAAAVALLWRLGAEPWAHLPRWDQAWLWLGLTAPVDVVLALARTAALVLAVWLLATTLVYAVASLTDARRSGAPAAPAVRVPARYAAVVGRVTPPVVRRLVDRAVAASLMVATVTTPAGAVVAGRALAPGATVVAAAAEPVASPVAGGEQPPPPGVVPPTTPAGPASPGPRADRSATAKPAAAGRPQTTEAPATVTWHEVVHGEHLWSIAATVVAAAGGDDDAVAPYWWRLVESNRDRLRSGDPDLIFPGELVYLPPFG